MGRKRLGRGLESLLQSVSTVGPEHLELIPIERVVPNPMQPRQDFDTSALTELKDSIAERGVLQPIVVRPRGDDYEIVMGERRWRASRSLGLDELPAIVRDIPDNDLLEVALIENIQRKDLNPVEKSLAFHRLSQELGLTHGEIARRVGKNRSSVTNYLRLLELPDSVQDHLKSGRLSMGHARAILALDSSEAREEACQRVLDQNLSVRETEHLGRTTRSPRTKKKTKKDRSVSPRLQEIERSFESALMTKVRIRPSGREGGQIVIDFYSQADFSRIEQAILSSPA